MKKWLAVILCCMLLLVCASAETDLEKIDFTLTTADGGSFTLSECSGKVVFINFWGTWCPYCILEMPALNDLAIYYAEDEDVAIITLNYGDDAATAQRYLAEQGYENFIVPCDLTGAVTISCGVEGFPTTLVFDREGNITERIVGITHPVNELKDYYIGLIEALK